MSLSTPSSSTARTTRRLSLAELAQARASVIVKEAAVVSARANLGYCRITSPVDGVVVSRKVGAGQTPLRP